MQVEWDLEAFRRAELAFAHSDECYQVLYLDFFLEGISKSYLFKLNV